MNTINGTVSITKDIEGAVSIGTKFYESGTTDYNRLINKPSIEGHTLQGDSTLPEIGVGTITPQDIDNLIFG